MTWRQRVLMLGITLVLVAAPFVAGARPWPTASAAQPACASGATLDVVAHEDDDLLFQSPTILREVQAGRCLRTVYVTSGDAGDTSTYWMARESGSRAAYAAMAGVANSWTQADAGVGGHPIPLFTSTAAPNLSLAFLRLPDGNIDGSGFAASGYQSLQKLYAEAIPAIDALDGSSSYSKADLSSTLLSLMNTYHPMSINTLDYVGSYGDGDHSDHHTVAYLTQQAQLQYPVPHAFAGYEGYNIANRDSNLDSATTTTKANTFFTYAQSDYKTCSTADACYGRPEASWLSRQYTVGVTTPSPSASPAPTASASPTPTPTPSSTASSYPPATNVAGSAVATASSAADGQPAASATDGVVDGYPGDYTREWASQGGKAGSWINLAWPGPVTLDHVVLYDRPNTSDRVTGGTLRFSDGSSVTVPSLTNSGAAVTVSFTARATTSLRFTVRSVSSSTLNVGLAELQAWTPPASATATPSPTPTPSGTPTPTPTPSGTPTPTVTPTASSTNLAGTATTTASSENPADGQTSTKVVDGVVDGYPGDYTREWATRGGGAGSWVQLNWTAPVTVGRVVLDDRPNADDQVTGGTLTFSDGTTVGVGSLTNDGTGVTVTFPTRTVTSLRLTVTAVSETTANVGLSEFEAWTR